MFEDDIITALCLLYLGVIVWEKKKNSIWERHGAGNTMKSLDLSHILPLIINVKKNELRYVIRVR